MPIMAVGDWEMKKWNQKPYTWLTGTIAFVVMYAVVFARIF